MTRFSCLIAVLLSLLAISACRRSGSASTGTPAAAALCDKLAAHPDDPTKPAGVAGVPDDKFASAEAIDAAVDACLEAIEAAPQEPRFRFELGRLLLLSGLHNEAREQLQDAAAKGSAAACFYLVQLDDDYDHAHALLEKARDGGFKPAAEALRKLEGLAQDSSSLEVAAGGPALPLHSQRVATLSTQMLGSFEQIPGDMLPEIDAAVSQLSAGGHKVLACSYGDPVGEWHTYYFWYETVPSNLGALVANHGAHPLRALGGKALTTPPANSGLALKFQAESRQALP